MRKIPSSYFEQHGCHDCRWCFAYYNEDSTIAYYCSFEAPDRPPCGSAALGEEWDTADEQGYERAWSAWVDWADGRQVKPWGICAKWKLSES